MSRPTVSKAKTSYPIFAATFANNKPGILVVGGGGGAGNHGIKNCITAFDFSSRAPTVQSIAEIEASADDSITSIANLATKNGLILYAGINSSDEDRLRGANEHFRSFEVQFPKSKAASNGAEKFQASISFLSKTALFTPPKSVSAKKEAYQRLVRLSPAPRTASDSPNRRIGVVASSLAGDDEIVIFSATSNKPRDEDIIGRIMLHQGQEANDVDIYTEKEGRYKIAYIADQEVYVQDVNYDSSEKRAKGKNEHRKVYTIPQADKKTRSKLRSVRFLTPKHLLLLVNQPGRTGVELIVLHMYDKGPASLVSRKRLPRRVKAATDMDVALLPASPDTGAYQIAIAVGAIDISLSVYTMDYHGPAKDTISGIHSFNSYDNVHEVQMTKVVFEPFYNPDTSTGREARPRYLRLASTSLGNTISVETFQLQPDGSRYVLQTARSRNMMRAATYLVVAMVVAVIALLHKTFGESLREKRHDAILNGADSPVVKGRQHIADLLHHHLTHILSHSDSHPSPEQKAIIIHQDPEADGTLSAEVHEDDGAVLEKYTQAKKWDDLSKEERKLWREKLSHAGMWAVEEGETILKSIFFGQIGGLVGQVAQGVIG